MSENDITTRTRQDILTDIESEIREIMYRDALNGANDYAAVKVAPDGSVYSVREPSYCLSVDEWEGDPPHIVTVWNAKGMRPSAGRDDGVFEWEEIETIDAAKCWEDGGVVFCGDREGDDYQEIEDVFLSDGKVYRLTDSLVEEFDLVEIMGKIDSDLDEYEWIP